METLKSVSQIIEETHADFGPDLPGQIDDQTFHPFWSGKRASKNGINRQVCLRLEQIRRELDFYEYPRKDFPKFHYEIFGKLDIGGTNRYLHKVGEIHSFTSFIQWLRLSYGIHISTEAKEELEEVGEIGVRGDELLVVLKKTNYKEK